jgi:hypothetical protein
MLLLQIPEARSDSEGTIALGESAVTFMVLGNSAPLRTCRSGQDRLLHTHTGDVFPWRCTVVSMLMGARTVGYHPIP